MFYLSSIVRRLRNICFAFLALIYALFRGHARQSGTFKNIAIVYPTNNIGDVVCITPLFETIKSHDPSIRLTVMGSKIGEMLLEHHPYVDEYVVIPDSQWSFINEIRKRKIDAGVAINMDTISVTALFLGGVRSISCLVLEKTLAHKMALPYRLVSHLVHTVTYTIGGYIPRQLLGLLYPFSIPPVEKKKLLSCSVDASSEIADKLHDLGWGDNMPLVALAPGAGSDLKQWPADRFGAVANYLSRSCGAFVVMIGGKNDRKAVEGCVASLDPSVRFYYPGPLSMDHLKAVLSHADLLIGNDSGAVHVAQAMGTATVAVVGITAASEHLGESATDLILRSKEIAEDPYHAYIGDEALIDPVHARKVMEAVEVEDVCKAADDLLQRLKTGAYSS